MFEGYHMLNFEKYYISCVKSFENIMCQTKGIKKMTSFKRS